jgi:hypothetical protein
VGGGVILTDQWQQRATTAAIKAARDIVSGGVMPPDTPVAKLTDKEWGWLFAAMLFAWVRTRAEQATAEGRTTESVIRDGVPDGWDAGAVASILQDLANVNVDWSKPLSAWPRETMIEFLRHAFDLVRDAMTARDRGGGVTRQHSPERISREANAGAGNPLVVPRELSDSCPF